MDRNVLRKLLNRDVDVNKYDFGHVLIIGGASGMVGAPMLSAMGALRAGAGLVTIASSPTVIDKLEKRVLEVMTFTIPQDHELAVKKLIEFIRERRVSVVVIGPGFDLAVSKVIHEILKEIDIPALLDAGALTSFQSDLESLDEIARRTPLIITPHDGEFEKLTGIKLSAQNDLREEEVSAFAQKHHLIMIAKGSATLVASPDGTVYKNSTGNPGLATAGSGDVLAGIIGGLVAQGISAKDSSEAGVHLHGLAGDIAMSHKTQAGMIASDIVQYLPDALKTLE